MILDYVERVTSLTEMEHVWTYHLEVMAAYGFNRVLYGFTRFRTERSLGDPQDMLVLTNHDRDYIEPFLNEGLYLSAPMTHWALNNVGSSNWRGTAAAAAEGRMGEMARKVWEFNKVHGLGAGYTVSFLTNSPRAKGAISLTAVPAMGFDAADDIWARHGREIEAMSNVLHLRLSTMPNPNSLRPLTPRQREVLEWVGDGKTTADTAEILGLTAATVEKHLRLAREALDVSTTAQAVLKASFLNQIFVLED
ncbi:LuxR family transcriptional regulator [Tropicimonas sp. IMCC6043]|uniref:helix-turn-helix transcriptional regulator n=1 Tax=Tropicimonas sp. IMCC6043 TaxID=2510645 RepID=UPI00101D1923|nr:LuxR family transcriptional regulator [Tropicimonas sp. IMCC6043]RYH12157.1 LuxR family transcriptional regulator [Tropicimonas sp. IMCC6043]